MMEVDVAVLAELLVVVVIVVAVFFDSRRRLLVALTCVRLRLRPFFFDQENTEKDSLFGVSQVLLRDETGKNCFF